MLAVQLLDDQPQDTLLTWAVDVLAGNHGSRLLYQLHQPKLNIGPPMRQRRKPSGYDGFSVILDVLNLKVHLFSVTIKAHLHYRRICCSKTARSIFLCTFIGYVKKSMMAPSCPLTYQPKKCWLISVQRRFIDLNINISLDYSGHRRPAIEGGY